MNVNSTALNRGAINETSLTGRFEPKPFLFEKNLVPANKYRLQFEKIYERVKIMPNCRFPSDRLIDAFVGNPSGYKSQQVFSV